MNEKSVKKNIILNTFRMMLTVLMPLITFPYTSRIFLTDGSGQINFSNSVAQIFTLFASLGIYTYGVREGVKVRENKREFTKLAHELLIINGISTILTYIVYFFMIFCFKPFDNYRILLLINGLLIGFTALGLDWVYGVYEEYSYITIRQIVIQILTIVLMFILVHKKSDIYIWVLISVVSNVGANVFNFIHAKKYLYFQRITNYRYKLKRHLQPIFILFATQLASKVYSNLDVVLLGIFATDDNVGLYSAAVKVNTILITFFSAMYPVFLPRIVRNLEKNNMNQYYSFLRKAFGLIFALGIPTVIGIEILSEQMIFVLSGQSFLAASTTIRILAPIILVNSLSGLFFYNVLVPNKKENIVLICTVAGALINLILSIILIPYLKQNGAALGSLISECFVLIFAVIFCRKNDKNIKKGIPNIINYIIGSVWITLYVYIIKTLVENWYFQLFVGIFGGAILYFAWLLLVNDSIIKEGISIILSHKKVENVIKKG